MYLLQIVLNVHYGTTGIVDRHIENYQAESLKPLLIKCNKRISESSDSVTFNCSFYHLDYQYVTQIKDHTFNFEKMDIHNRLLYFYCSGLKCEVDDDR